MADNKYTPKTIDKSFIIPLYQRLFEWEEAQVLQLLNDLYSSFKKTPESPYYIGMLTAFEASEKHYSLVDGQQRFTVLTLMGIVLDWKGFLKVDDKLRLSFFARKKDEAYLNSLINKSSSEYTNRRMKVGIECIQKFMADKDENFKNYIYTQTTFFISELPKYYNLQDLNRYFETMNEAGKGLENHEVLKVILLKKVTSENYNQYTINYNQYTIIWNSISEMDKCIIRQKEKERQEDYKNRNASIFKETSFGKVFGNYTKDNSEENILSLKDIQPTPKKPSEAQLERNEKAMLSFTDFLLQVLWLCLLKENRKKATDFFNRNKLLETFETHIKNEGNDGTVGIDTFFTNLLKFRVLFDYYIIRLNSSDERNITYSLNQVTEGSDSQSKQSLIHYQSMLYVSTEPHIWLTDFLEYLRDNENTMVSINDSLQWLQNWDNQRWANSNISLIYGSINRYWFWRLDYYLWARRNEYFTDNETKEIADKYVFRSNRSIEHIAPQTPKTESQVEFKEGLHHKFGNLAMISAGQNSSLQNSSFEMKKAYVQAFISKSVGGSIQSLKMLSIYQYDTWNEENIKQHHNKMIDVLIKSFGYSQETGIMVFNNFN